MKYKRLLKKPTSVTSWKYKQDDNAETQNKTIIKKKKKNNPEKTKAPTILSISLSEADWI